MTRKKLTDKASIRKRVRAGESATSIAKDLGVSQAWISQVIRESASESVQEKVIVNARNQIDLDPPFKERLSKAIE